MPRIDYDRLLQTVSIENVAERLGMALKQTTPTQAKALCPFHDDKTPSLLIDFSRDRGRQHYYCFACGAHGDVIDLVKKQLNLGFMEAVKWLDPNTTTTPLRRRHSAKQADNHLAPAKLSGLQLGLDLYKASSKKSEFDDWVHERNLDPKVLSQAGYLFSPRNSLSRSLDEEIDPSTRRENAGELEDAYLIHKVVPGVAADLHLPLHLEKGAINRYSDFFIGDRIIFPIRNQRKELIGLAGRAVQTARNSRVPKYQFSRGFPKSTVLYREDHAFELVRSLAKSNHKNIHLYLCEGFLDALRFETLGMAGVAVMGSMLSEHQILLLRALNDELPKDATLTVVVSFDRDEAGLRGAADACLKLMRAAVECAFLWPTARQLETAGCEATKVKDPNDYLQCIPSESARKLVAISSHPPELAVLANAFSISADDIFIEDSWASTPRSRRFRSFNRALSQLRKVLGNDAALQLGKSVQSAATAHLVTPALTEWITFARDSKEEKHLRYSDEFLNSAEARLNHSRILAYMGSRRGELPCDEPRWERLDIAATAFNTLLTERLTSSQTTGPIGPYNAVWVPRSFGGSEHRLKMMPCAEDLTIQQYLLNEILTERWDHQTFTSTPFSQFIPAVRYYREGRRTVTTGFDVAGDGRYGELTSRTLSFAYQIDMDVLEGRQPATDQGMYRPYHECWRDFMNSLTRQASEIGYVYSVRLDVKRYYDRLRRFVVRDRLLPKLRAAISTVTDDTPKFAELVHFEAKLPDAAVKASTILDRLDEHLFGVTYARPDTGHAEETDPLIGIPQGPVLSAWIGSIALFPVDEAASRLMDRMNAENTRIGYARYVDDIVLLADDPRTLEEMREEIDRCASNLRLSLLAKADEIPAMSADEFSAYVNQGRALAASGPAWEPPLVGDGEPGWEFWSVTPTTDRQSALQLLHNVELYKASKATLLETVKTAFQAPDLRASELSKAARLIWYSLAVDNHSSPEPVDLDDLWSRYLEIWNSCVQGAAWSLQPEKNEWESPLLFALEGLEHLIDKEDRDVAELSAEENFARRQRTVWLARRILEKKEYSDFLTYTPGPQHQLAQRFALVRWKALRAVGERENSTSHLNVERSRPVKTWEPFAWMHEAISLLAEANPVEEDPLSPFVDPTREQSRTEPMSGLSASVFKALLPHDSESTGRPGAQNSEFDGTALSIALQTLVSIAPKQLLPAYLSRRQHLIWEASTTGSLNRITLPPLPGVSISRLYSGLYDSVDDRGVVEAHILEAIDFPSSSESTYFPQIFGSKNGVLPEQLTLEWQTSSVAGSKGELSRHKVELNKDKYLYLRERMASAGNELSSDYLKQTARLFRAIVQIVTTYAEKNEGKELVPAWPYIAATKNGGTVYLIGDGVPREEIGSRAFVRDGGRALRTIEVPIYEAHLWRVGVAVSDYLGLHDDVTKFSNPDCEVTLDATALANPARYVLRAQLRKLRGAYADSQISKRQASDSKLPAAVERALNLLESFPEASPESPFSPLLHVLATEAESAGMYLSFRERWRRSDTAEFLTSLTTRVLSRLPLSVSGTLLSDDEVEPTLRRELAGLLSFARTLSKIRVTAGLAAHPAWRALLAGIVSSAILVAIDGLIASMRSQGSFERYAEFDFPEDWEISPSLVETNHENTTREKSEAETKRLSFTDNLRQLIQRLGHRLNREVGANDHLSDDLYSKLKIVAQTLARIDAHDADATTALEWPFGILSNECLDLLTINLLESVVDLTRKIDEELKFEVILVVEKSFGYNAQTRRFTDSRSGVRDVAPWMISHFPRNAKHIEEVQLNGRFHRVWSEVFDRRNGTLLSVSALGEPFASISVAKPNFDREAPAGTENAHPDKDAALSLPTQSATSHEYSKNGSPLGSSAITGNKSIIKSEPSQHFETGDYSSPPRPKSTSCSQPTSDENPAERNLRSQINSFRKQQFTKWSQRGEAKPNGHIRIALLQADFDITYKHPIVEACPTNWPFSASGKEVVSEYLTSPETLSGIYRSVLSATNGSKNSHLWMGSDGDLRRFPSWSEHRRQTILKRVIDSCQEFGVDLLVLPEYSVRRETIDWLKEYLSHKTVSVLAGTYMNLQRGSPTDYLSAPLTLVWPMPKKISQLFSISLKKKNLGQDKVHDALARGHVFEFSRNKKYRSIALDEFFRPASGRLGPLFKREDLAKIIEREFGFEAPSDVLSDLLANTRLPLQHLLELICSEIFLLSSPANYGHMTTDLNAMRRRFGDVTDPDEVFIDIKNLSGYLSITGDGINTRRSLLAVPAATSRSADYWIAGQSVFLAAGTATVFCNSIDGRALVGGSCFIGNGSWKSDDIEVGYVAKVTPYHGWSKGIFYNNKNDALSKRDQAVVIVDMDPHNMLEGKPRAQTMPSPLQLVAYLPLIELADWNTTERSLLRTLSATHLTLAQSKDRVTGRPQDENKFWDSMLRVQDTFNSADMSNLWGMFPDKEVLAARAEAYHQNGDIQPTAPAGAQGIFCSPALYDWIDVSLTLGDQQELPTITVPPWRFQKS